MRNPFGPDQDSGSYVGLQKRIFQRFRAGGVSDQMNEMIQKAWRAALEAENIVLAKGEKKRLLADVLKLVLDDVKKRIDDDSPSVK